MPAPLSNDIRERVVAYSRLSGATYEYIAEALGIGRASVSRILRLHRETGSVDPKPAAGGPKPVLDEAAVDELVALVSERPDATLYELAELWASRHPEQACSRQVLGKALQRRGITRKKSPASPRTQPS